MKRKSTLKDFCKYILSATNPVHTKKPDTENVKSGYTANYMAFFFFKKKLNTLKFPGSLKDKFLKATEGVSASIPTNLNRPGQVQYHRHTQHCN